MKNLKSNEIRNLWIKFFKTHNHYYVEPKSLIPVNDDSLLWINSGVATLKSYFDGSSNPPAKRLTNVQKSLRTNDVSNVGVTSRHHTFFEMLGNFSIGDYFKEEALKMALEFLISPNYLDIDVNKLYFTIYEKDHDAFAILKKFNIASNKIILAPKSTNFWDMGQGPCGPNCEIFYDRGEKFDLENIGTDLIKYDYDNNERYIEIWNIVFSEFNNDGHNNYEKLPRQNIDTGAGFERLVSLSQHGYTNFDSDLFKPLITKLEEFTTLTYDADNYFVKEPKQAQINTAFKVIVDHVRALCFAISDGAYPSNLGRGYVLRRLIRRSMMFARKININENVLHKLVPVIVSVYGDFYANLITNQELITKVILQEELSFAKTIEQGQKNILKLINENRNLTAHEVFVLYDTYGFPFELSQEIAQEHNITVDFADFEKELNLQREKSKLASSNTSGMKQQSKTLTKLNVESNFVGFEHTKIKTHVNAIFDDQEFYEEANNTTINVCFAQSVFYATKGGQNADQGLILNNEQVIGQIIDVFLGPNNEHIHVVKLKNKIMINSEVTLVLNEEKRLAISANHSATHIVHQVLYNILGENLKQAGSSQDEFKSRFDFSVFAAFDKFELMERLEQEANDIIAQNIAITTKEVTYKEALTNPKVFAEFSAKYDDLVRVVSVGDFNVELCGGTHVNNTKLIEKIFVRNISSKGSNVYRVEFITTNKMLNVELEALKSDLLAKVANLESALSEPIKEQINLQQELNQKFINKINLAINNAKKTAKKQKQKGQKIALDTLNVEVYNDVAIYVNIFEGEQINTLRTINDALQKTKNEFISVVLNNGIKKSIIVSCSNHYDAGDILKKLNPLLDCSGGGKKQMVQGSFKLLVDSSTIINKIKEAL